MEELNGLLHSRTAPSQHEDETITCDDIKRTIIKAHVFKDFYVRLGFLCYWAAMVVLMYLATAGFQDSQNSSSVINGIIGTFESDFRKFPISDINSHVSTISITLARVLISRAVVLLMLFSCLLTKEAFYDYVHRGVLSGITDEDVPGRTTENNQIT